MENTTLIHVGDLGETEIALLPEAIELRDKLLSQAAEVTAVADAFDADCAADVLKAITVATKAIETTRKEVKAPVLDLGKRIDGVAKEFSGRLDEEKSRISKLLGAYEAMERKKREEAERIARNEAIAKIKEAESTGDESRIEKANTESAQIMSAAAEVAHRPEGTAVRETWEFEVTDIDALYKAAPYLCRIEPDGPAIRAAIKKNQNIPGLRVWKEAKSYIR